MKFPDRTICVPKEFSLAFCRQFLEHYERDKAKRSVVRNFHNNFIIAPVKVATTINKANLYKAIGLDEISLLMLKILVDQGVEYFTKIFNLSMESLVISNAWNKGKVIPILKLGRVASEGLSYRPIFLSRRFLRPFSSLS